MKSQLQSPSIKISEITQVTEKRIEALIEFPGDEPQRIYIEASREVQSNADTWLLLVLPIAMKLGFPIFIDGKIDSLLSNNLENLKREYILGNKSFKNISVITDGDVTSEPRTTPRTASFFSGGLDSFYTASIEPSVKSVICVWGFDIPLQNLASWDQLNKVAENFAQRRGHELTTVKTNLKTLSLGRLLWGRHYHGWALSAVAQALRPNFDAVLIPGDIETFFAKWGTNGNLNALCSTSQVRLSEHGTEPRVRKMIAIDQIDNLAELRVCLKAGFKFLNCGECKKCRRTRLELDGSQSTTRPSGLEEKIDTRIFAQQRISKFEYTFLKEDQMEIARIGTPGFGSLAWHLRRGRNRDIFCNLRDIVRNSFLGLLRSDNFRNKSTDKSARG